MKRYLINGTVNIVLVVFYVNYLMKLVIIIFIKKILLMQKFT